MERINKQMTGAKERPVKVVQFGEGNFLRAFVDYMFDLANEQGKFDGSIVLIKPIEFGSLDMFHEQDCQYTVTLSGRDENGEAKVSDRIITSVADAVDAYTEYEKYNDLAKNPDLRFVVSNTTEAGIVYDETDKFELCPPATFPGKLTKFLYTRYQEFNGDKSKGLIMLPVELIDDNGMHLKECVLKQCANWGLEADFVEWVKEACIFTQTLVDRIVTGYPRGKEQPHWDRYGYEDKTMVTAEPFSLWVIESDKDISGEFPIPDAGFNVILTKDHHPYKQRKVRILNGAHTCSVLGAYLYGTDIVRDMMNTPILREFVEKAVYEEIIPTLTLPAEECKDFAAAVFDRFDNPYVDHALLAISLNSVSKWKARVMPSFLGSIEKNGKCPARLGFSLAALMAFYTGTEIRDKALIGNRDGAEYNIMDDAAVLEFMAANSCKDAKEYAHAVLSNVDFWGQDLSALADVEAVVVEYLASIKEVGAKATYEKYFA